jgi:hypothetical protein
MIQFTIPLTKDLIVSEANRSNEHWTKKSKRHQTQKLLINAFTSFIFAAKFDGELPFHIKMIRIAPRSLDFDNLVSSFKWIRDELANSILLRFTGIQYAAGRADGDERLIWEYLQEKGLPKEYAIRIEISSI